MVKITAMTGCASEAPQPTAKSTKTDKLMDTRADATLRASTKELRAFATALMVIAEKMPASATASQLAFFLNVALADIKGGNPTFSEIKGDCGAAVGRSLHTTYRVFLDGAKRRDSSEREGLNWLADVVNPDNRRQKFLHLTPLGKQVLKELAEVVKSPTAE